MDIKKDKQIKKFCFYGFFKNLKFFEPYLFIYFINNGLSFFDIGILFSIKEFIIYLFEIPSGIIADYYGKKNELKICFIMYIISFLLFFIGHNFFIMLMAMIFFGLGEAFRSGTHKAMIYSYLEEKEIFHLKSKVYGYTRSYSKIGSAISSFLAIIIAINLEYYHTIFLFSILPYLFDFFLINSYPESLNEKIETEISFKNFLRLIKVQLVSIISNKKLNNIVINSSVYSSVYSIIKDYIQPVIVAFLLLNVSGDIFDIDKFTKISLGLLYGFFSIGSVVVSRNSYKANKYITSQKIMSLTFFILGMMLILVSIGIKYNLVILVLVMYFIIFISEDFRKPHFVSITGDYMKKEERATVMSYTNQIKSTLMIVLSPLVGLIADKFSVDSMFLVMGIVILIIVFFIFNFSKEKGK
jgi:MFS family permease